MRILPVLDLMNGVVVRGVGGRRSEYRPVASRLAVSADPADVAAASPTSTPSPAARRPSRRIAACAGSASRSGRTRAFATASGLTC
jgi:hypothetical protein